MHVILLQFLWQAWPHKWSKHLRCYESGCFCEPCVEPQSKALEHLVEKMLHNFCVHCVTNSRFQVFDHLGSDRSKLEDPMKAISDNTSCTTFHCQWLLQNAVSFHVHMRARRMDENIALVMRMADSHQKLNASRFGQLVLSMRNVVSWSRAVTWGWKTWTCDAINLWAMA